MHFSVFFTRTCKSNLPHAQIYLLRPELNFPTVRQKAGMLHSVGVGPTYALRQTGNTRERIEARVETRDLADSILFHN
jgi:hypothetical protein